MPRDDRSYLTDILNAAIELRERTQEWTIDSLADTWNRWAAMKGLEIIGEAAGRLSDEARQSMPEIPWSAIVGMRNILIHAYFRADDVDMWATLQNDVLPLENAVRHALNATPPTP
jgi:uncharacterized protein with HEPN domain